MSSWRNFLDQDDMAYGARPAGPKDPRAPRAPAHHVPSRLLGAALVQDVPPPPCNGCARQQRCAVRAEACEAWRRYVQGQPTVGQGEKIRPMRKLRD